MNICYNYFKDSDNMDKLKSMILNNAVILENDNIVLDSFLNQFVDIDLLNDIASRMKELYKNSNVTKIVSIESAGIIFGTAVALALNVPLVYAKKEYFNRTPEKSYASKIYSYTKKRSYYAYIPENYISPDDNVLIVDDVIANGWAADGLIDIINQADANLEGIAIAVEKAYHNGAKRLRSSGTRVESLVKIKSVSFETKTIEFED